MTENFKGMLPRVQKESIKSLPSWKYGFIKNEQKIIDPQLHYSCFILGYNDIQFVSRVMDRFKNIKPETGEVDSILEKIPKVDHVSFELAEKLYQLSGGYKSFFALSGSDANEGAVKLASAYHKQLGNTHKKNIVSLTPSYHGSTLLTSSIGYENALADPFYTMDPYPNIIRLDRNFDIDDVDWNSVFCLVVETCSYGQGLTPFTDEFWSKLTHVQKSHDVILIIDDIFMGGGKTGHFIGWKHLPVTPDIFTMGKAITGGYFPLSVTLYNDKISNALGTGFDWNHGYTYSFSLPGFCSALEYLNVLENAKLLSNYDQLVERARQVFENSKFKILNRFGLFFMIEFAKHQVLFMIPLTADDDYFVTLADNLDYIANERKKELQEILKRGR